MKKNFLMVAALLVAAMLMVVSCSQEVAPKNDGLVEARIDVAYGRDLSVSGNTEQDGITLEYAMYPNWKIDDASERIYGGTGTKESHSFKTLTDGKLGYVTPGLWTIIVNAKGTNGVDPTKKVIFSGTANVYFSETTKSAKVFLAPVASDSNTIKFNFKIQALSNDMTNDYEIEYKLAKDGSNYGNAVTINSTSNENNVYTYSTDPEPIESGFYRVNVSIYRKGTGTDRKLVGGTTKGFLVSGGATVEVKGNIEPSDYENVTIDAVYVKVNTSFKNVTDGLFKGTVNYTGNGGNATVIIELNDTTNKVIENEGYKYTVTDMWNAVSDSGDNDVNNVKQVSNPKAEARKNEFVFSSPGYKNVSCTTVYSITGKTTNDTDASVETRTYYFANTVSAQVYIDPVSFSAAPANSQTSGQ